MRIIKKNETLTSPIYIEDPFPLLIMDDFISINECETLISDAAQFVKSSENTIHGGRKMLNTETDDFNYLLKKSINWENFYNNFIYKAWDLLYERIRFSNLKDANYNWLKKTKNIIIPYLISIKRNSFYRILMKKRLVNIRKSIDLPVRFVQSKILFLILLEDFGNYLYRKFISTIDILLKRRSLSALFDYSIANKGYGRMVHRDSDSRIAVVLLYLNDLEDSVKGGELCIYSTLIKRKKYNPIPNEDELLPIYKIEPKAGRLILFLNTANSYHSVNKMTFSNKGRLFIYGGYTTQTPEANLVNKKSTEKSLTEYHLYR